MTWRWTCPAEPADRERLAALCWLAGATGVWEQPTAVVAFFDEPGPGLPDEGTWEREPDQDWMEGWRDAVQPLVLGSVAIVPTWLADGYESPAGVDQVIVLDQGTGFGTGHHPTTAGCLAAVRALVRPGDRVVDVGCGSGILAIAAAQRGAAAVVAVDLDPSAVAAARLNVARNGVDVDVRQGSTRVAGEAADVVLANLLTDTIVALAADLAALTAPGGHLVVSGIGEQRKERPLQALADAGLTLDEETTTEGWVVAVLSRPHTPGGGTQP